MWRWGRGQPGEKDDKDWTRYKYKRVTIEREVESRIIQYVLRRRLILTGNGLGGSQAAGIVRSKPFTFPITNRPRPSLAEVFPTPPSANSVE